MDYKPGCTGKVAFQSAALANKAARRKSGREAYHCKHCGFYHAGSSKLNLSARDRRSRGEREGFKALKKRAIEIAGDDGES